MARQYAFLVAERSSILRFLWHLALVSAAVLLQVSFLRPVTEEATPHLVLLATVFLVLSHTGYGNISLVLPVFLGGILLDSIGGTTLGVSASALVLAAIVIRKIQVQLLEHNMLTASLSLVFALAVYVGVVNGLTYGVQQLQGERATLLGSATETGMAALFTFIVGVTVLVAWYTLRPRLSG